MKAPTLLPLIAALLACTPRPSGAIEPEKMEGVVYRMDSFAVEEYALVYAPPQVEEVCLIAGTANALDPRHTLIYYWPLTREYFQAWEQLDVPVDGRLEIRQDGRLLRSLEREPVGFYSPAPEGPSVLVSGETALRRQAEDARRSERYKREAAEFGERMIRYQAALREYVQRSRQGGPRPLRGRAEEPPQRPAEPPAPTGLLSDLKDAFVVDLPVGKYTVLLRAPDGTVVEGSERKLSVFEPLARGGVGYEIFPEERWTARLQADTPESGIYCIPGKELFLIPHWTESFAEDPWVRLKNPQATGLTSRPSTVYVGSPEGAELVLLDGARTARRVELKPYYVRQVQGAALGYRIVEYSAKAAGGDSPSFLAYRLRFEAADAGKKLSAVLEDPATHAPLAASRREIRIVGGERAAVLWLVSLVPLLIGAGILIWRRRLAWNPGQGE